VCFARYLSDMTVCWDSSRNQATRARIFGQKRFPNYAGTSRSYVVGHSGLQSPATAATWFLLHEAVGCQGMYTSANRKGVRKCHPFRRIEQCLTVAPLGRFFFPSPFLPGLINKRTGNCVADVIHFSAVSK
jgi:hypothetical protein